MYNRGRYNRGRYNRPTNTVFRESLSFSGIAESLYTGGLIITPTLEMTSNSGMTESAGAIIPGTAEFDADSLLEIFDPEVQKILLAAFNSGGSFQAEMIMQMLNEMAVEGSGKLELLGGLDLFDVMKVAGGGALEIGEYQVFIPSEVRYSGGSVAEALMGALYHIIFELSGSSDMKVSEHLNINEGIQPLGSGEMALNDANIKYNQGFGAQSSGGLKGSANIFMDESLNIACGSRLRADFIAAVYEDIYADLTLEPGDVLVINTERWTATLNGQNVLEYIKGSLPHWIRLNANSMDITVNYSGSSEIDVKIDYIPRWK